MDLLCFLARFPGEVLAREILVDGVWSEQYVGEAVLRNTIAALRNALGDDARKPTYIQTISKRGYCLIAPISFEDGADTTTEAGLAVVPKALDRAEQLRPYPGLAAFTQEDAELFFGREDEVQLIWRKLQENRLLGIIGPSGVGKSSLVRAGLVPSSPAGWAILVCTPGDAPFTSLAKALVPVVAGDTATIQKLLDFNDPQVAVEVVIRWRRSCDEAVLVIDQFEELWTGCLPEEQARFASFIGALVRTAGVRILLSMRDDFLMRYHDHEALVPVFECLIPLGTPAGASLRRALTEPAASRDYRFEDDALVDEMLAEVEGERGALPLLAFAVSRLWDERDTEQRRLSRETYRRIGGVAGAVARHAEEQLHTLGEKRLPIVRELFRNLVTGERTRVVRDVGDLLSVFSGDAQDDAEQVLRSLIDARLLTEFEERSADGITLGGSRRVEIVHEALLDRWPRLVGWQTQDADAARLREQLRQAARLWEDRGRPDELLWTGAPFLELRVWQETYPGGLTTTEQAFARAMVRHSARRRNQRRMVVTAVLIAVATVAVVTTMLWRRSEVRAQQLEVRRLNELARLEMSESPPLALAYAVASLEIRDGPEARKLALEALWHSPMPLVISPQRDKYASVVNFSPDGEWLAVGEWYGHLALWPKGGGQPVVWRAHQGMAGGYFSPDSKTLISATPSDPQVRVWSVPDARMLGTREDPVRRQDGSLSTGPDIREVNNWFRIVRLTPDPEAPGGWNVDQRAWDVLRRMPGNRFPPAALSPDGGQLVYALDGDLTLVSLAEPGAPPLAVGSCGSAVEHVAYHPDGARAATFEVDGTIRLWSLSGTTREPLREWQKVSAGVCSNLLFDPTGAMLVASFDNGSAFLWFLSDPPEYDPLRLSPVAGRMLHVAFTPDGSWLATGSLRRICLWPLPSGRYPHVLRGHAGRVESLAFAPDGSWLASAGSDGTVRCWPLNQSAGHAPLVLFDWGHDLMSNWARLAVTPDGRYLVVTGNETSARLVPVDGSPPRELGDFDEPVLRTTTGQGLVLVSGAVAGRVVIRLWRLDADTTVSEVDLGRPGEPMVPVGQFAVLPDGRLLVARSDGSLVVADPGTGEQTLILEGVGEFALSPNGALVLARRGFDSRSSVATAHDLVAGVSTPLVSHGKRVISLALDPTGTVAVTANVDGILRVGPVSGEPPLWLVGGTVVGSIAVSPDGRFIAAGGLDGTIRLWPMPDLSRIPLHDLPGDELITRLKTLSNLRVVPNPEVPGDYMTTLGPFPGWEEAPVW